MRNIIMRERKTICKEDILKIVKVGALLLVVTVVGVMLINNVDTVANILNKFTKDAILECNNMYEGLKNVLPFGKPKVVEEIIIQGAKFN